MLDFFQHPEFVRREKPEVIPEQAPGESESLVYVPVAAAVCVYRNDWLVPFLVSSISDCSRLPAGTHRRAVRLAFHFPSQLQDMQIIGQAGRFNRGLTSPLPMPRMATSAEDYWKFSGR